jgi:alanine racemase
MCANGSPPLSSRKGEALSGIVTNTSAGLYAIPARASLGQDDEARNKQLANVPAQATAALIVRLGALRRNYAKLGALAKGAETAGVVKANAYGLGAEQCVHALSKEGCRTFFVATFAEAETLRALSSDIKISDIKIYVLDGLLPRNCALYDELRVRPVLGSLEEVAEWAAYCRSRGRKLPAAIHVDTGMARLGLKAHEALRLAQERGAFGSFEPSLVMTHLVCGDDAKSPMNEAQRTLFAELSALFPGVPRSLANSAGIFLGPRYHFDVTRPGISLYGGNAQFNATNPIDPVVSLFGRIAQVHWADSGETVGYGATHTLNRRTRIATACLGYADGFFRAFSASNAREGPPAYIGEHRLPLLGRVSMDLITYDATDAPDSLLHRGGWLEVLGSRVTVDDLASFGGTIGYEVLTSLSHRYYRIYVDE